MKLSQLRSFSSHGSAFVLGGLLLGSLGFATITHGQSLVIPSMLENSIIAIKQIVLTPTGTTANPRISLDGVNGTVAIGDTGGPTISLNGVGGIGSLKRLNTENIFASDAIWMTDPAYQCANPSSGCALTVNSAGKLVLSSFIETVPTAPWPKDPDDQKFWKQAAGGSTNEDIYFGNNNTAFKIRVGVDSDGGAQGDSSIIASQNIDSRVGLRVISQGTSNAGNIAKTDTNTMVSSFKNDDANGILTITAEKKTSPSSSVSNINFRSDSPSGPSTKVGINLAPGVVPSDALHVNGSARADAYYYNSDRRYKDNISVLGSSLEKISKLTGYSYFNKLTQKADMGVIAQEVEQVYPSLVKTDDEGYKTVQYGNLIAPVIEAIKELGHKIDGLFASYVSQQAQISQLEARIQALESSQK